MGFPRIWPFRHFRCEFPIGKTAIGHRRPAAPSEHAAEDGNFSVFLTLGIRLMSWFGRLLQWLVVALIVLSASSLLLPATQRVERSLMIEQPPDRIWELLEDPTAWNRWSPYYARDPDMKINYTGAPRGMGARWHWDSASEGSGTVSIIGASVPRQLDLIVVRDLLGTALCQFILEPVNSGTKLTWKIEVDATWNPILRWLGLGMERWIAPDFERGLDNIRELLAQQPK